MFKTYLEQAAGEYGIHLSPLQLDQMTAYYGLLVEWNEKINLTAITEPREVAVKHMIDSLSCYYENYFPQGCQVIDVGTGAGFPGVPLKIYRPDIQLTLIDSLHKRLVFLRHLVTELSLDPVVTIHSRAEEGGRNKELREQFDVVLSRAVARLNVLCELCLPFVKKGGHFIALKGAQQETELVEAQKAIEILGGTLVCVKPVRLPGFEEQRAVLYIRKDRHTPGTYPRKAGLPEKKPL